MRQFNQKQPIICPALVSADPRNYEAVIAGLDAANADMLHLDIMDGCFAPQLSYGPDICNSLAQCTNMPVEVHLAVRLPTVIAARLAYRDYRFVTVHVETMSGKDCVDLKQRMTGCGLGLALQYKTPVQSLYALLHHADKLLLQTCHHDTGAFAEDACHKVEAVAEFLVQQGLYSRINIQVDGGVADDTIGRLYGAGATEFVSGSSIFKKPGPISDAIARLKLRATVG